MKCEYCNKEYSKNVWKIHVIDCIKRQIKSPVKASEGFVITEDDVIVNMDNPNMYREMSYNELRQEASENNLELGANPKKKDLIKALEINKFGETWNL